MEILSLKFKALAKKLFQTDIGERNILNVVRTLYRSLSSPTPPRLAAHSYLELAATIEGTRSSTFLLSLLVVAVVRTQVMGFKDLFNSAIAWYS